MLSFSSSGSTSKMKSFLNRMSSNDPYSQLEALGQQGVNALMSATPVATGLTAHSWAYEIEQTGSSVRLSWINTHNEGGVNIAIILQYGHGTGTGGYVAGRDYINPAIKPIMDKIADEVWRTVTGS